jgi:hypothetical protein
MRRRWFWAPAALLIISACEEPKPQVSFAYDRALTKRLVANDAAWPTVCSRPPEKRIGLPPSLYRESKHRPVPPDLVKDLREVVEDLPRPFARLFERHVCAVVLMHDAPMTGTLKPLASERTRSIILLDVDKLSLPPNEWLVFKESSAFEKTEGLVISGKMADARDNTRRVLLEFLLVHELGHVVDAAFTEHLLIDDFRRISWPRRDALAKTPLVHYPERKELAPLPDEQIEPYYDVIAAGAFASPATVSNAEEDFAESLATFMHTVLRGRPWELEVRRDGQLVRRLETCWTQPRCSKKREILDALLARWSEG